MSKPTPDTSPGDEIIANAIRRFNELDMLGYEDRALPKAVAEAKDRLNRLMLTRERKLLEKLSMDVVEPCEPECDPVRHARHEGTWQAHLVIEKHLEAIDAQLNKEEK